MGVAFWIKRFLVVLAGAFAIISVAQALQGHTIEYSATQGAIWGAAGATIFTVARFRQARRGRHCALCRDTPEGREEQ
jgi:hypothetical protein